MCRSLAAAAPLSFLNTVESFSPGMSRDRSDCEVDAGEVRGELAEYWEAEA